MSTRRILLIEHDQGRRLRLGTAIVRRKWRLRTARCGEEALATLYFFVPAVIVLDLDLLVMPPDDLVQRIREMKNAERATIVGMIDRDRDAASLGVDALLTRPFSLESLFEVIDHACARRARQLEAAEVSE